MGKKHKFNLEDFVIEVSTNNKYFVLGIPMNCTIKSLKQNINLKAYVIANRAGTTLIIPEDDFENGSFILANK